jgi:type I restriction enzyme S subunit
LQETEIGSIPVNWRVAPIEQVITGTQYGTSSRAEMDGRYPMLRMNNLVDGQVDVTDLKYIDLDDAELEKFRVHRGDVLFNRTNSFELVGKTSIFDLDGEFVFASYLVRVVADPSKCLPEYLNHYLNWQAAQRRLKQLATRGVSQSNINATKLRGFEIGLPPLAEQGEIVRILSIVDAKIATEEVRRDALNDLFHSLLHHLMTGKVRVPFP